MAFWMEMRCDGHGRGCYSDRNEGPMVLAQSTQARVLGALSHLELEGAAAGWRKTRRGWICPACQKVPDNS